MSTDIQSHDEMRAFIGKRVVVTLSREPDLNEVRGWLVDTTEDGEVAMMDGEGKMRYSWPALAIREEK